MTVAGERHRVGAALVVGGGFIGEHIVRELASRSIPVRIMTRSRRPWMTSVLDERAIMIADASRHGLDGSLDGVDEVVYCVGGLLPADAQRNPEEDSRQTLEPLAKVVRALRARPEVGLTVMSSGGTVYGNPLLLPVSEDTPTAPIGAYGAARLAAEKLAAAAADHGTCVRILRCANVYGPGQLADRGHGVVAVMVDRITRGEPLVIYGDGRAMRDYVEVGDLAGAAVRLLGRRDGPTVVNVGTGVGTTVRELLALAESLLGRRAVIVERPARSFDVDRIVLDIERLRSLIDYHPCDLRRGLQRLIGEVVRRRASVEVM